MKEKIKKFIKTNVFTQSSEKDVKIDVNNDSKDKIDLKHYITIELIENIFDLMLEFDSEFKNSFDLLLKDHRNFTEVNTTTNNIHLFKKCINSLINNAISYSWFETWIKWETFPHANLHEQVINSFYYDIKIFFTSDFKNEYRESLKINKTMKEGITSAYNELSKKGGAGEKERILFFNSIKNINEQQDILEKIGEIFENNLEIISKIKERFTKRANSLSDKIDAIDYFMNLENENLGIFEELFNDWNDVQINKEDFNSMRHFRNYISHSWTIVEMLGNNFIEDQEKREENIFKRKSVFNDIRRYIPKEIVKSKIDLISNEFPNTIINFIVAQVFLNFKYSGKIT